MTDEKLKEIFLHFDVDDTGYISKENISESMTKMGHGLTPEEIDQVLGIHDVKGDEQISFEEFKHMFLPNEQWITEEQQSPYRVLKQPSVRMGELSLHKRMNSMMIDVESESGTSGRDQGVDHKK